MTKDRKEEVKTMAGFHLNRFGLSGYRRVLVITVASLALTILLFSFRGLVTTFAQSETTPATDLVGEQKKDATDGKYHLECTNLKEREWPNPSWSFCIQRIDGLRFEALKESDIRATLNGQPVKIVPGSLKLTKDMPQSVFLMIDCSGSMVDSREGMNKLEAAKKALMTFINNLEPGESAVIATFAGDPHTEISATYDKKLLIEAASKITHGNSRFTHLYDALDFALKEAYDSKIQNLIFLSDGWEWPDPERSDLTPPSSPLFESYKAKREQKIAESAQSKSIRVFTIAIGTINGSGQASVDYQSLKRISDESSHDDCTYIPLQELKEDASHGKGSFEELLAGKLNSTLREIRKAYSYTYSLELEIPPDPERKPGVLEIAVKVPDGNNLSKLPVSYSFFWPEGADHPKLGKALIADPIPVLMEVVSPKVPTVNRVRIYFWLFLAFFTLALVPPAAGLLTVGCRGLRARRAIVAVGRNSTLLSKECPSERDDYGGQFRFKEGDNVIICSACKTPHHLSCWKFSGYKCMRHGCTNEMPVSVKVMAKYDLA
jgi:hypothetical protein